MKVWLFNFALFAVWITVTFGLLIRDGWAEAALDGVIGGAAMASLGYWRRWPARWPFRSRPS